MNGTALPSLEVRAHIGGMDVRALLIAHKMIEDGKVQGAIDARYKGWNAGLGKEIMDRKLRPRSDLRPRAQAEHRSQATLGPARASRLGRYQSADCGRKPGAVLLSVASLDQ
jgi:xylose isomerase